LLGGHGVPGAIFDLYDIAKASFLLYEQGERIQSTEAAYELRDVADHLIHAARQSDAAQADADYLLVSEHLLNIAIDPLERKTQERMLRIDGVCV
jgi:hypothetical protein